jgi:hypothetical protein
VVDELLPQTSLNRCYTVTVAADDSPSHLTPVVLLLMPRRDDSVICDSRESVNNTKSFDLVHLSSWDLFLKHQQTPDREVPVLCFDAHADGRE